METRRLMNESLSMMAKRAQEAILYILNLRLGHALRHWLEMKENLVKRKATVQARKELADSEDPAVAMLLRELHARDEELAKAKAAFKMTPGPSS